MFFLDTSIYVTTRSSKTSHPRYVPESPGCSPWTPRAAPYPGSPRPTGANCAHRSIRGTNRSEAFCRMQYARTLQPGSPIYQPPVSTRPKISTFMCFPRSKPLSHIYISLKWNHDKASESKSMTPWFLAVVSFCPSVPSLESWMVVADPLSHLCCHVGGWLVTQQNGGFLLTSIKLPIKEKIRCLRKNSRYHKYRFVQAFPLLQYMMNTSQQNSLELRLQAAS